MKMEDKEKLNEKEINEKITENETNDNRRQSRIKWRYFNWWC